MSKLFSTIKKQFLKEYVHRFMHFKIYSYLELLLNSNDIIEILGKPMIFNKLSIHNESDFTKSLENLNEIIMLASKDVRDWFFINTYINDIAPSEKTRILKYYETYNEIPIEENIQAHVITYLFYAEAYRHVIFKIEQDDLIYEEFIHYKKKTALLLNARKKENDTSPIIIYSNFILNLLNEIDSDYNNKKDSFIEKNEDSIFFNDHMMFNEEISDYIKNIIKSIDTKEFLINESFNDDIFTLDENLVVKASKHEKFKTLCDSLKSNGFNNENVIGTNLKHNEDFIERIRKEKNKKPNKDKNEKSDMELYAQYSFHDDELFSNPFNFYTLLESIIINYEDLGNSDFKKSYVNQYIESFKKGLFSGLLLLANILALKEKFHKHKGRTQNYLDKHFKAENQPNYEILLLLKYYIEHNAHEKIFIMVAISHELALTYEETFLLTHSLGFYKNESKGYKDGSFLKHFNNIKKLYFYNYTYLDT